MQQLIENVIQWGGERGLHDTYDLRPQLVKLTEELGEIAAGVARDDAERIEDGVGDLLVVLINFGVVWSQRYDRECCPKQFLESALQLAWDVIKERQGKTVDGVFVKEEKAA